MERLLKRLEANFSATTRRSEYRYVLHVFLTACTTRLSYLLSCEGWLLSLQSCLQLDCFSSLLPSVSETKMLTKQHYIHLYMF